MRFTPLLLAAAAVLAGCAPTEPPKKAAVALDQIPANVMKVAKEKLPNTTFERAVRKPNGEYEILGKDSDGKAREIDLTPAGEVTEIDK